MNQSNVYIGLYIDNHESLFYKKTKDTYYDLKAKKEVTPDEIQLQSLVPYNKKIQSRSCSKKRMLRLYDIYKMGQVQLKRAFIGNIYELEDATISTSYIQKEDRIDIVEEKTSKISLKKENALLVVGVESSVADPWIEYDDLQDLETGEIYTADFDFVNGNQYVPRNSQNLKSVAEVLNIKTDCIEKAKLLEKYREYRGKR